MKLKKVKLDALFERYITEIGVYPDRDLIVKEVEILTVEQGQKICKVRIKLSFH